ncbi:hypothetical protein B0T10DRAFT_456316 [Thelonectria olida]|uniref:Uncharacterized protein n=1 Tax=Thelonectria olida TaxID=1576542 RepID=A0A9P9AV75_9HYPO|nr:hypothetical protein B0T10DRAFT_456316 [Thelonectria olida]
MSQKLQNGNIKSFFKPVAKLEEPERPQTPRKSDDSSSLGPPSPSPLPPSSPFSTQWASPAAKTRAPPTRDLEIPASDDDDAFGSESSDGSLADLSTLLGRGKPVKPNDSPVKKLFATPKNKRTAVTFHSSPLAFLPKHKFDFRALARDAKKDDATNESSTKAKAISDDEDVTSGAEPSLDALEGIVKTEGGPSAHRVMRAVQRSGGGHLPLRYCFFKDDFIPPPSTTPPKRVRGPWGILTKADEKTRVEHFENGIPTAIFTAQGKPPDELFNWVLDELCVHESFTYREECIDLITRCPEQIERLVTPKRLKELFLRLGVSADLDDRESELPLLRLNIEPYEGRGWGCVESFLALLKILAVYMALPSVVFACHALLRMALDTVLYHSIELLKVYQETIQVLLHAVPEPNWAYICFATCSLIHKSIKPQSIRANVLACLPRHHIESSDLRRRLALTFLFDDPELAQKDPDKAVTVQKLIDRLDQDDFALSQDTDFTELQASILFLNTALDDGHFVKTDDPNDEKQFNEDIDELVRRLREIWKEINDSGMKLSRTELKSTIDWVRQRLMYSVRTKKKAKSSIFDTHTKEDKSLPKQREYMTNFLRKMKEDKFEDAKETKEEIEQLEKKAKDKSEQTQGY